MGCRETKVQIPSLRGTPWGLDPPPPNQIEHRGKSMTAPSTRRWPQLLWTKVMRREEFRTYDGRLHHEVGTNFTAQRKEPRTGAQRLF